MSLYSRPFLRGSLIVLSVVLVLLVSCLWLFYKGSVYRGVVTKNVPTATTRTAENAFVVRSVSSLMLDRKPFRFSGADIYCLGLTDHPTTTNPLHILSVTTQPCQVNPTLIYPT